MSGPRAYFRSSSSFLLKNIFFNTINLTHPQEMMWLCGPKCWGSKLSSCRICLDEEGVSFGYDALVGKWIHTNINSHIYVHTTFSLTCPVALKITVWSRSTQ